MLRYAEFYHGLKEVKMIHKIKVQNDLAPTYKSYQIKYHGNAC